MKVGNFQRREQQRCFKFGTLGKETKPKEKVGGGWRGKVFIAVIGGWVAEVNDRRFLLNQTLKYG